MPPEYGSYAHPGCTTLADDYPAVRYYYADERQRPLLANTYLHFAHAYDFENPDYDGGYLAQHR
jgi:hypothetical protein